VSAATAAIIVLIALLMIRPSLIGLKYGTQTVAACLTTNSATTVPAVFYPHRNASQRAAFVCAFS
jgi:hypothetical protein